MFSAGCVSGGRIVGLCFMVLVCGVGWGGEKELLPNAGLVLEAGQSVPAGWYAPKDTNAAAVDGAGKAPNGASALKVEILQDKKAVGYLATGIRLTKPNQNLTFTGQLRSTPDKRGYYELRLTKGGKILKQITGEPSTAEWKTCTLQANTGDADGVSLFCRYVERKDAVGGTVWFGAPSLRSDTRQISLALIGDSTVANYKPEAALRGWGQMLPTLFKPDVEIRNAAVPGTSSKTFPDANRWRNVLLGKPDYVLIQFGHNDAHDKAKPESTDAATTYRDNLMRYIKQAREVGATPILVTPMRRRLFSGNAISAELEPYAAAMREVAKEAGVALIDLHERSASLFGPLGDQGCVSYYASATDRSHFSPKGATALARMVAQELLRQVPALAGELLDEASWPKVE